MNTNQFFTTFFAAAICFSCHHNPKLNVDDFVFMNFNLRENRSLKYSGGDTLFLQKRFPEQAEGNYFIILTEEEKIDLVQSINNFEIKKYKSDREIYTNKEDGRSYAFLTRKNEKNKVIMINGNSQIELNLFAKRLYKLSSERNFKKTSKILQFWDIEGIFPPPPPPIITEIKYLSNGK